MTLIVYAMSVFYLKKGQSAKITAVNIGGAAGERLRSLGVEEGKEISVIGFSLFKGGVLIAAGFNRLALRKAIALKIEVSV